MPKRNDCFDVEGLVWEQQSAAADIWAIHVEVGKVAHVCCWAYASRKQYLVQRFVAGQYTGPDEGQWLDPMEAMCVMLEAQNEAEALKSTTSRSPDY